MPPTTTEATRADLRQWRLEHELSQAQLARELGVSWLTVQRWEAGVQNPPRFLYLALRELERQLAEEPAATDWLSIVD